MVCKMTTGHLCNSVQMGHEASRLSHGLCPSSEMDIYMELPAGVKTKHVDIMSHVLKLLKSIYGQKQVGQV